MANFRYPCIVGWSIFQVANHYSPTYCHGQKVVKMLEQLDQIRVLVDGNHRLQPDFEPFLTRTQEFSQSYQTMVCKSSTTQSRRAQWES